MHADRRTDSVILLSAWFLTGACAVATEPPYRSRTADETRVLRTADGAGSDTTQALGNPSGSTEEADAPSWENTGSGGLASTASGGGTGSGEPGSSATSVDTEPWWKPKPGLSWQWNRSGSIDTDLDVTVFNVDLFDAPPSTIDALLAKGRRVICFFSAGSAEDWRADYAQFRPSDLGTALDGWPGERWLDTRSEDVRTVMKRRLALAESKRCHAVEPANTDAFDHPNGLGLTKAHAIDYVRFLATEAHARGLSIGLKNSLELVVDLVDEVDWALSDQCGMYNQCDALLPFIQKNKAVFHCEYQTITFNQLCQDPRFARFSSILKNPSLTATPLAFCP
jgi:hypothetical protein